MNPQTVQTIEECTKASDEERASFGEVVTKLLDAGIERYHADLLRSDKIYYMPDGASHRTPCHEVAVTPSNEFSGERINAAIRAIQNRAIGYKGFCEQIAAAGCVGYIVSLAGRRAVYYGRTGESFVEPFPKAA